MTSKSKCVEYTSKLILMSILVVPPIVAYSLYHFSARGIWGTCNFSIASLLSGLNDQVLTGNYGAIIAMALVVIVYPFVFWVIPTCGTSLIITKISVFSGVWLMMCVYGTSQSPLWKSLGNRVDISPEKESIDKSSVIFRVEVVNT